MKIYTYCVIIRLLLKGALSVKFADRIKELRQSYNYTQKELADKLHSSKSKVSMWEQGERDPVAEDLTALSKIFECSTDYLLGLSNIRKPYEVETIAAHKDGEDWTDEELQAIEQFKEFVRSQKKN